MTYEFKLPDVGEGIHEAELVNWLVKEGDAVSEDQPIAEVETDKAIVEIPSPKSGRIVKLHHKKGDTVKVGDILVSIEEGAAAGAPKIATEKIKKPKSESPEKQKTLLEEKEEEKPETKAKEENKTEKTEEPKEEPKESTSVVGEIKEGEYAFLEAPGLEIPKEKEKPSKAIALPSTRMLAKHKGVDIEKIKGTGTGGRVTDSDVMKTAGIPEKQGETAELLKAGEEERVPFSGIRKAIARHMVESHTKAVHVTHMDEADVTEIEKIRQKYKPMAEKAGTKITLLAFIIKAMAAVLKSHPEFNSSLDEKTGEIVLKKQYHAGIALDTQDGLIVPVISNADEKSVLDIAKEIMSLAKRGRERKLKPKDLRGSTFTITNIGSIGGVQATPIINYPECCILGVMRMAEKARIVNNEILPRNILPLNLTFDHRIADGAQAARFMNDLIRHLEDPTLMIVDVV